MAHPLESYCRAPRPRVNAFNRALRARLVEARENAALKEVDVAAALKVSVKTVRNWERDNLNQVGVENLAALATLYEVSSDWLLGLRE